MAAPETVLEARCLCKAAHLSVAVPKASLPLDAHLCHCDACRRTHGSLCVLLASIPRPTIELSALTAYASSKDMTRYFCTACGTHMVDYSSSNREWTISTSIVEGPETLWRYTEHIYLEDTKDGGLSVWLGAVGGKPLKKWAGRAPTETTSESNYRKTSDSSIKCSDPLADDVLHASCHCGGVAFNIARPTATSLAALGPSLTASETSKWVANNDVCTSCRFSSGCAIFSWVFPAVDCITLTDGSPYRRVFGTLKEYHSSPDVSRTFCGVCGAKVAYHVDDRPGMVDIAAGLLHAPEGEGVRVESWLEWKTQKLAYEEDVVHHELIAGFKEGLKTWSEEKSMKH